MSREYDAAISTPGRNARLRVPLRVIGALALVVGFALAYAGAAPLLCATTFLVAAASFVGSMAIRGTSSWDVTMRLESQSTRCVLWCVPTVPGRGVRTMLTTRHFATIDVSPNGDVVASGAFGRIVVRTNDEEDARALVAAIGH